MKNYLTIFIVTTLSCTSLWAQKSPTTPVLEDDFAFSLQVIQNGEKSAKLSQSNDKKDRLETADKGIELGVAQPEAKASGAKRPQPKKLTVGQVKISAPWPAKPLAKPPVGWKLAPAQKETPAHQQTVTLKNGQKITLSITPYILVPDSDGKSSYSINEPGYKPQLGLAQKDTVTSVIQKTTDDIEKSEKQIAEAIRRLQLLTSSLPKP